MGMLLAITRAKQLEEEAQKRAEMPVKASPTVPVDIPDEPEEKAVETAKKPVKRATRTTRKTTGRRKTSK